MDQDLQHQISKCLAQLAEAGELAHAEAPPEVRPLVIAAITQASGSLVDALAMLKPREELCVAIGRAERAGDWREVDRLLRVAEGRARARDRRAVQ